MELLGYMESNQITNTKSIKEAQKKKQNQRQIRKDRREVDRTAPTSLFSVIRLSQSTQLTHLFAPFSS